MNNNDKRETAMILASSRRASQLAIADTKPCRVCGLPDNVKKIVEGLLGTGLAIRPIADMANDIMHVIDPDFMNISTRTIEQHRKNHIPIRLFMQREVIERRAKAASLDVEGQDGSILTPAAYAEIMMNAGAENLLSNPELVSPMEGLAAAKTLHDFDANDNSQIEVARMVAQLNAIIIAVKAVCSPAQLKTISTMIGSDKQTSEDDIDAV